MFVGGGGGGDGGGGSNDGFRLISLFLEPGPFQALYYSL